MEQPVREETLRLRPPRNLVERRAIWCWATTALLEALVPVVVLVVLVASVPPARSWLLLAVGVVLVVGIAYAIGMPVWRYRVHRWEVTEDAVYTRAGWLWQQWRVAPMSRIQTVDSVRGPIEQLFSLASVTVTTASAAGPIKIEGLDRDVAADLVRQLTETAKAHRGDAT